MSKTINSIYSFCFIETFPIRSRLWIHFALMDILHFPVSLFELKLSHLPRRTTAFLSDSPTPTCSFTHNTYSIMLHFYLHSANLLCHLSRSIPDFFFAPACFLTSCTVLDKVRRKYCLLLCPCLLGFPACSPVTNHCPSAGYTPCLHCISIKGNFESYSFYAIYLTPAASFHLPLYFTALEKCTSWKFSRKVCFISSGCTRNKWNKLHLSAPYFTQP